MVNKLFQVPLQNSLQYTLDTGYTAGGATLVLNSTISSVVQAPGVCVVDRVDSSGNKTVSKREYFTFTGVSGQQLTGCAGGLAGSTNQDHAVGAVVEFIPDIIWAQALYDTVTAEHSVFGQHLSLASVGQIRALDMTVWSTASIQLADIKSIALSSQASLRQANVLNAFLSNVTISGLINASGASVVGLTPSGASGAVLVSQGNAAAPTYFTPPWSATGGFNGLFQVPGGLASQANVGGLIPVPSSLTVQYLTAFLQTPASIASVSATILKNNAVVGVIAVLAGATYASGTSLSNTSLVPGDELRLNINSTASLATDLSVLLRAT